jgi:hemerythrin superfamily protein
MDALRLLKRQHRLVARLFDEYEQSDRDDAKKELFSEIADNLAVHAIIEERWFYPALRAQKTEEELEAAYDEHIDIKKLIIEAIHVTDELDARVAALKAAVEHHVAEEERELFPIAGQLLTDETLESLGQKMQGDADTLIDGGAPRNLIHIEREAPMVP